MKKQFALNYLMSQMWALDQSLLSMMAEIADRGADSFDLNDLKVLAPQAVEGKSGRALTPRMELREGGVAVIHVTGVISRYASMFDDICGGISTQALAKDFCQARDDPAVRGIVLNFDSPGGDANGIHELAEMVFNARGTKPIVGYVGGTGASAIYWIASACDELVIDATACLGSIGVVMSLERTKPKPDDENQKEQLTIVSSQSPNKWLNPWSKDGKAKNQEMADQLADIFIDRVARNMDVTRETVLEDFGQGGVLIGQSAIDKGMASRLGSLEGVIAELKQGKTMTQKSKTKAEQNDETIALVLPTAKALDASAVVAALTEQRPDVMEAIQGKPPVMALSAAADIAKACADAGIPALSADLLKDGITKAQADAKIQAAGSLKDTLAAAGLSGSFNALVANLDDPIKLVGQAIHEAKASGDESGDGSRHIVEGGEKQANISAKSIYDKRKAQSKK
jgi:ClpP class serine protease